MKKLVFIVACFLIIAGCFSVAVIEYNNHKVTLQAKQTSEVQKAQADVKTANATLKQHDAVNAANLANDAQVKATLCNQIKAAKLPQPLCQ